MDRGSQLHMRLNITTRRLQNEKQWVFHLDTLESRSAPRCYQGKPMPIEAFARQCMEDRAFLSSVPIDAGLSRTLCVNLFRKWLPEALQMECEYLAPCIAGLLVHADTVLLPWQLFQLPEAGAPWVESFPAAQWSPNHPPRALRSVRRIAVLGPKDAPDQPAWHALDGVEPVFFGTSIEALYRAFTDDAMDVIHFQGLDATGIPATLGWGETRLRPEGLPRKTVAQDQNGPLICIGGHPTEQHHPMEGTGDGWAETLAAAGASAVLGAHWQPPAAISAQFFTTLYRGLSSGLSLGGAAVNARHDLTDRRHALAFALYGIPWAHPGDPLPSETAAATCKRATPSESGARRRVANTIKNISARKDVRIQGISRKAAMGADVENQVSHIEGDTIDITGIGY